VRLFVATCFVLLELLEPSSCCGRRLIVSTHRDYTLVIICVLDRLLKSTTNVKRRTWPSKNTENIVTCCMVSLEMSHRSSC